MKQSQLPSIRVRSVGDQPVGADGEFVLYWMTAFRRSQHNFALQRAVEWSQELNKPLLVFEALRSGYQWASDRIHRFVIEGMVDNAQSFEQQPATYFPYLEPEHGAGKGLLAALAERACVVVSDDFPSFFLPRMVDSAKRQIPVKFELIDSNGLLPMRAADRIFSRAFDFRRYLQKNLLPHLAEIPAENPLSGVDLPPLELPTDVAERWPAADLVGLSGNSDRLSDFPIDHAVSPAAFSGGERAAHATLNRFLKDRLSLYESDRNQPEVEATSGLSPYLHFGHISVHQVFDELTRLAGWSPENVSSVCKGSSSGWWGASAEVESFLDELITWRELGYNMCWQREDYDQFDSLPDWAQRTLAEHADDPREYVYSLPEFEAATTHDPLWNAAQRQLTREGRMHNYLRMLWGKKILEWSESPQAALDVMIELNNKYAVDGRNPNSYSGIFWVLGRYDRAWGPERPIFGKIRYMSSQNTARKVKVKQFLQKYSAGEEQKELFH